MSHSDIVDLRDVLLHRLFEVVQLIIELSYIKKGCIIYFICICPGQLDGN